jgi:tyrosinase
MALDDPDLATYRDFVGIMKGKNQSDRVSWLGFSLQHGKYKVPYKYCPHGNWYFIPWHREFVNMYENAAMELTGNKSFAMPYWDWTIDRELPTAFSSRLYKGAPNPLYVPNRNYIDLPDDLVGPKVMEEIYSETLFEVFGTSRNPQQTDLDPSWVIAGGGVQGRLEATPHNNIHNRIGAYMPTAASPIDPIFMMHHGNIDRIWAYWNALGRTNSTADLWLNMPFEDNFIAPNGDFYSATVKNLQSTEAFGYTYPGLPAPDNKPIDESRHRNLLSLFSTSQTADNDLERMAVKNTKAASALSHLNTSFSLESLDIPSEPKEVFALIKDIKFDANILAVNVFVNSTKSSLDMHVSDLNFVTTIAFLSHEGSHHKMAPSAIVDLTTTLRALHELGHIKTDEISIQLVPVPQSGIALESAGTVVPASIEVVTF